jgi:hypothetical protein
MRKLAFALAAVAALSFGGSEAAQARYYGHGYGWVGPAIAGGLILGAIAASRPHYGYPYGYYYGGYPPPYYGYPGYPAYGYPAYAYGGCYVSRRVVGYTRRGAPIIRRVRVCGW